MTNGLELAIDMSNYTGPVTPEQATALYNDGHRRVVVGTQDPLITQGQIDVLAAVGIEIEAYTYLRFDRDAHAQVVRGIAALGGRVARRMWLDAEDETAAQLPANQVVAFLYEAARACEGVIVSGIYTRQSWWAQCTGNSEEFKDFPLWFATDDKQGDLSFEPFGGWKRADMEQYSFDQKLQGIEPLDLDVYRDADAPVVPAISPPFQREDLLALYLAVYELTGSDATIEPQPVEGGRRVYKVALT